LSTSQVGLGAAQFIGCGVGRVDKCGERCSSGAGDTTFAKTSGKQILAGGRTGSTGGGGAVGFGAEVRHAGGQCVDFGFGTATTTTTQRGRAQNRTAAATIVMARVSNLFFMLISSYF
jgi:hypothetical protein